MWKLLAYLLSCLPEEIPNVVLQFTVNSQERDGSFRLTPLLYELVQKTGFPRSSIPNHQEFKEEICKGKSKDTHYISWAIIIRLYETSCYRRYLKRQEITRKMWEKLSY